MGKRGADIPALLRSAKLRSGVGKRFSAPFGGLEVVKGGTPLFGRRDSVDRREVLQRAIEDLGIRTSRWTNYLAEDMIFRMLMTKVPFRFSDDVPVAALVVDKATGKKEIVVNIDGILKVSENFTKEELEALGRFVIKHEYLHYLLKHWIETPERPNKALANIVQDALINFSIPEYEVLEKRLPKITPEQLIEGEDIPPFFVLVPSTEFRNATWEEYYDALKDKAQERLDAMAGGAEEGEAGTPGNDIIGRISEEDVQPSELGELAKIAKEAKERGLLPGNLVAVLRPKKKIPEWQKLLKSVAFTNLERNWSNHRLNRHTNLPPGKIWRFEGRDFVILVDVSGSMADEVEEIVDYLHTLARQNDIEMTVYTFDTQITGRLSKKDFQNDIVRIEGFGGTDIKKALAQLKNMHKKAIDTIVVITDGYDEPPTRRDFPRCRKIVFILSPVHDEDYRKSVESFAKTAVYGEEGENAC